MINHGLKNNLFYYSMEYKNKFYKYKIKYENKINLVGGKDCDIRFAEDILSGFYIKDITNFIPFEKSVLYPMRKQPVCSYSIWDEHHTQLYVPIIPNENDKLYKTQPFYIRLHHVYFASQVKGEDVGIDLHVIMWSPIHKKWYQLENWPQNDNLLEKLFEFLNVVGVIESKVVINNLLMFRKEYKNNPAALSENLKTVTDLINSGDKNASSEILEELTGLEEYNHEIVSDHEE